MYNAYTIRLIRSVQKVSNREITICEAFHVLDCVDGTYLGIHRSKFFKQLVALLNSEQVRYDKKYREVRLEDLGAKEEVGRRKLASRIMALNDLHFFELNTRFGGLFTFEEWINFPALIQITKGWHIWKLNESQIAAKVAHKSKYERRQSMN